MELNPEDIESFLTVQEVSAADAFGKTFKGHIPANNPYGLKEMDVAIKVSHNRTPQTCDQDLETMFKVWLFLLFYAFGFSFIAK